MDIRTISDQYNRRGCSTYAYVLIRGILTPLRVIGVGRDFVRLMRNNGEISTWKPEDVQQLGS